MLTRTIRALSFFLAAGSLSVVAAGCGGHNAGTWTDRTAGTPAANQSWTDIASDATGTHLVAVTNLGGVEPQGDIWTSADAGVTWTNRTAGTPASRQGWASVTSDTTGTNLAALTGGAGTSPGGDIWTSTDAGATWTKRTTLSAHNASFLGASIASDATGTHLVVSGGDVWTSADAGATWVDVRAGGSTLGSSLTGVASDSTGTRLVAFTLYSDIWTSSDAGTTWINRTQGTPASGKAWQSVASDSTGTHLVAVNGPSGAPGGGLLDGDIWTSSDSGVTWNNQTQGTAASGNQWSAVVSDASGAHFAAVCSHQSANDVWASSNSGATWSNQTAGTSASGQEWLTLASNADGSRLVALSVGAPGAGFCCEGDIWTN